MTAAIRPSQRREIEDILLDAKDALYRGQLTDAQQDELEIIVESFLRDLARDASAARAGFVPAPWSEKYRRDLIGWCVERMGIPKHTLVWSLNPGYKRHQWDGTKDPLLALARGLEEWHDVGVEAGTGTQKTFTAALVVLWFLDCWENSLVVTAAPKEKQLTLHLWKEISQLWPRFVKLAGPEDEYPKRDPELTQLRIRMRPVVDDAPSDVWSAQGFVAGVGADEQSATKAQGFHRQHMLIVIEEMPGVHAAITNAFENTSTAPHNLRLGLGNPDNRFDELHKFCVSLGVTHVRISANDHPNVVSKDPDIVPGAISQRSIDRRATRYGADSPLYNSRVRGISPMEAVDALIRYEWLLRACGLDGEGRAVPGGATREAKLAKRFEGPPALGVDVAASKTGDHSAITEGEGALLVESRGYVTPDPTAWAATHIAPRVGRMLHSSRIAADSVGVGAAVVGEMNRQGKPVMAINGGLPAWPLAPIGRDLMPEERFENLRAQQHWAFRQELFEGEFLIDKFDEELFTDLTSVKWGTRNGKIFMEKKEDLRDRLPSGRSPDLGDSAIQWNWARKDRRVRDPYGPGLSTTVSYGAM